MSVCLKKPSMEDWYENPNFIFFQLDIFSICRKTRTVYPKGEKLSKESVDEAFNDESPAISYSSETALAYRSSHGDFYHFPISQSKQFDNHGKMKKSMYRVEFDDFSLGPSENRRLIPGFFSLEALIKHYKTFAYHDAEKGILETFPIKNKRNSKN
ncbi:hypothetical protein L3Y34_001643 [Caenorhabditis briggsae]|uniref:Uncharacterized protein n=1 Tax=Caenorhabditis briggsae TaxID=6238 RepID=A0AAE9DCP9_CAEBR|nr:hypothetical protein L3Y34_001643 [Caenorhabditis briggsae]